MCVDRTRKDVLELLSASFGIEPPDIAHLRFAERKEDIWASSASAALDLASQRMPGLRAFRRTPQGLKPTSAFLVCIAPLLRKGVVRLGRDDTRALLLGRHLEADASDGFVALALGDDVIGCGRAGGGKVTTLIPTGRRRELLEALERPPSKIANL